MSTQSRTAKTAASKKPAPTHRQKPLAVPPLGSNPLARVQEGCHTPSDLLYLQRTVGNRAVQRLLAPPSPDAATGRAGGSLPGKVEDRIRTANQSGGNSLPDDVRRKIEPKLGADLSSVRIHTDNNAVQLTRDLNAKAFTHGNHIYFGKDQSPRDLKLTAHEAVHTVQQGAVKQNAGQKGAAASGVQRAAVKNHASPGVIQRTWKFDDGTKKGYRFTPEEVRSMRTVVKYGEKPSVYADFKQKMRAPRLFELGEWLEEKKINDLEFFMGSLGYHPGWKNDLFGDPSSDTPLRGKSLSGYYPFDTKTNEKKLEVVGRSDIYRENDDTRILQVLRQISTQLYLFLEHMGLHGNQEQELQTMWTHGNLIMACNKLETAQNLFTELTKVPAKTLENLYNILTVEQPMKITGLSERMGTKLNNLYKDLRGIDALTPIAQVLMTGTVSRVTDLTDAIQINAISNSTNHIYILTGDSPGHFEHAEQRLIELRNLMQVAKNEPEAWVAGKKRPCFGCWIREHTTNKSGNYELHFQDQPGKAFMGTFLSAPPEEKETWHKTLTEDDDFKSYESERGRGDIGPESDSEDENFQFESWDDVYVALTPKEKTPSKKKPSKKQKKNRKRSRSVVEQFVGNTNVKIDDLKDEVSKDKKRKMNGPEFTKLKLELPKIVDQPWEKNIFSFL